MKLQLLRNATLVLTINGKKLLIDPMLAPKDSYDAIPFTANTLRNPVVDLPLNEKALIKLIADTDAVLVTHIHPDHWDNTARQMLPKNVPLFCQPDNLEAITHAGFSNVTAVNDEVTWNDITINRTGGQHGTGEEGKRMGIVSGYVITYKQHRVYIAGDTIWCSEVADAIKKYKPTHIVLNGGGARFITGDPIVMDIDDLITVCRVAPDAQIYVVHLEAVNHVTETRTDIRKALQAGGFAKQAYVPADGEVMEL